MILKKNTKHKYNESNPKTLGITGPVSGDHNPLCKLIILILVASSGITARQKAFAPMLDGKGELLSDDA